MLKHIRNICGLASAILVVGTAGSSDLNRITNLEINQLLSIAIALGVVAWICHRLIVMHRISKRRNARKATVKSASRKIG